ncbi:uncharacterized protein L969DRAFT_91564 [Mixia osmundae IAM 14324]|uniref:Inosine triphosphate pyrophosphatase n=1 Tax=Mixia osmundae (strain CBS 9802 / IAM 14324 / JCM 22182 / KY 12970) TaxID=764103 RepID=G7DZU8_MIXOS|nr:uncharacterized protein L969DRAFT_91564 [Mixia osmundae IAM 14324]KEI42101.1 hypothetical protein L969DRAFT_91564 [Mixia osmundae IAM 14324]GAA96108.1 hypothetical protein E5Q_02769 [Mixia osmundae IAM 14324]
MARQLIFVTGNANKLREVRQILAAGADAATIDLTSQALDLPEVQGTTQEVARYKVQAAAKALNGPCITEDTALCFDALDGLPGPYIKDFLARIGHDGLNKMLDGFSNRRANALCTFAYCAGPTAEPVLFEGRTQGRIVPARGPSNFGWDPIFEVEGTGKTYAEMEAEQKNKLSHRYKALEALRRGLSQL